MSAPQARPSVAQSEGRDLISGSLILDKKDTVLIRRVFFLLFTRYSVNVLLLYLIGNVCHWQQ